jgi:fibronectin-binding autotransporter adhesin
MFPPRLPVHPLAVSLSRFRSTKAIGLAMALAAPFGTQAANVTWESTTGPTPGDGFLWTNGLNWTGDTVPNDLDDLTFGLGTPGTIALNGNQGANSLTFNQNFTLGAYGTNESLALGFGTGTGNLFVTPGTFATINAAVSGAFGLTLSGGGKLYLTNFGSSFTGDIFVDGAGTTLVHRQEGPTPQYNGVGNAQEFGRFDQVSLGVSTALRTITLSNGGEYKLINAGNNPEGNFKNITIGTGGGTFNLAPGYLVENLDDVGQINATAETFTKAGKGRLILTGATSLAGGNPLQGVVNINGGMLSLDSVVGTPSRFLGIAPIGTTVNVNNGGTLFINSGTQSQFDIPSLNLNDGSILAINGNNHVIGLLTPAPGTTTATVNGTATIVVRDLFATQTARFIFMRTALAGSGTLNILGNTASGGTPRLVLERGSESTFSGTYRLNENVSLESNPRQNPTANVGKTIADGDIQFDGWAGTLDLRDSNATTSIFDYTTNEITFTSSQAGGLNTILTIRGDTAAGTGSMFNLGTLTMGNHRLVMATNTVGYQTGLADTAVIKGDASIIMSGSSTASTLSTLVFSNPAALTEDAAGRSLTLIKSGSSNALASDVIVGGAISISTVNLVTGTLQLRGQNGAITTGFGGAAPTITVNGSGIPANGNTLPTQGVLHLDNNGSHLVGSTTLIAGGNQVANNRIADSATLILRGNSILRMTSPNSAQSTETIGTTNVFGHGTFDLVKTGAPAAPVALTINTLTLGPNATANFTGTALGTTGPNSSRIVISSQAAGFMSPAFHQANEWAKYDTTLDNGFAVGVTPFVAGDYTTGTAENTWAAGQQIKQTATAITLTGSRTADRFNFQPTATSTLNVAGFVLTTAEGGIISSVNTQGFKDGATAAPPSGTAGITAGTTAAASSLFVQANGTVEFHLPIVNNAAGGAVTFVKSGNGTVVLSHQDRGVAAVQGTTVFTNPTWSSTNTGGWVINDGMLNVHRGQFLGATPTTVTLNGGQLEINEPVSIANDASILPGWGHHIVVNGNAMVGFDDNGEANDASTGDRTLVKLGSLTVNNGSLLGLASFSDNDIAFMGGATFNGKANLNIGTGGRSGVNNANIISGVLAGSGFDVLALGGNGATLVLGGTQSDTVNNTYDGTATIYGATVRLNKANGFTAITDGAASEDVIINGGNLFWGPGQHGDLLTTNQAGIATATSAIQGTNNFGLLGIGPTSPAPIRNAGMNQIADTAGITLLTGNLGEADRITNEKFGTLTQKGGSFNVGLGTMEVTNATISGGAVNIDRSGTLKVGTLTLLPGAPDMNVTTGLPVPGSSSTLEIGSGGVSLSGQNIVLGSGSSGNVTGSGGTLKLGGNVTVVGSDLLGGSYGRKGIYIQTGNSFRELGDSKVDLVGGNRDFNVETNVIFTVTAPVTNGGIIKSGGGALVLEPYRPSTFAGPIVVNSGVLEAKGDGALGTGAGGVTINSGGTVKLDSTWTYGGTFTVAGPGALIPGDDNAREVGALVSEIGTNRLSGGVVLSGAATLAGSAVIDPSVTPATGGQPFRIGTLRIEGASGITGTGNLTLSGNGEGVIVNGVNLTSGNVIKDGAGRWTISGASSFAGSTTVTAGTLRITNDSALGTTAGGTTVFTGSLELLGGISVAEPLTLFGAGANGISGAVVNVSGSNTLSGAIAARQGATLQSNTGTLTVSGTVTGTNAVALSGQGAGVVSGGLALGTAGLIKNGTGTWTLSGGNSFTGATTVNGGTLVLNYGTNNTSKLSTISPLNFGGGSLTVTGSSTAATSQSVGGVNLTAGGANITVTNGAGQNATLALGAITHFVGGTVNFSLPAAGSITSSSPNTNGILGGYATVGGQNWATVSGGAISAFTAYQPLSTGSLVPDNNNSQLLGVQTQVDNVTTNSLKIGNAAGVNLDLFNLTLSSGGVLFSGSTFGAITGTGTLSGATAEDELLIHTSGGTLEVTAPLIGVGGGSLTKAGGGKLFLSGNSQFSGSVNINGGTLSIVGPGGTNHPNALGSAAGPRNLNINGGTFEVVGGDYDSGAGNMFYVIGPAGGTVRSTLGSTITINDGVGQFSGPGDVTFTGGGRYAMTGGNPSFPNFLGNVMVDGGILSVGNSNVLGGRKEQTITLRPGSTIINNAGFGLGANGLPNNIIVPEGGVEFFALGASRAYSGDIQLSGTNTIALFERDNPVSERQIHFNGRVSGTNVTLNVFGIRADAAQPFYLSSGANELTGTINLNTNAVLEVRVPGSLGLNTGDMTVNLQGNNSRLLLRHYQNGDYRANVVVNAPTVSEINSDRLANFGGGANQLLTINNLTSNTNGILTFNGGNGYATRVAGTVTLNANTIINTINANALFENGITFANGADTLEKRGAGVSLILRGPSNHSGPTIVQQGFLILQGNGALPNTSAIVLRGGEVRIENSDVVNTNRLNDAAPITLGGGTLRITGNETLGTVTAVGGTTIVVNNPISETVPNPLTLTGFTRQVGSVVQFQSPDVGAGAVGQNTNASTRVGSRIFIPGQADTTQTIPGFLGNNSLDFIQYNGTTLDNGFALGVQDMRNPGNANSPQNYTNDPAEAAWNDSVIARLTNGTDNTTVSTPMTTNRALDAIKAETGGTGRIREIATGGFQLRIEGGGILDVSATNPHSFNVTGTGTLTAGPAAPGAGTAELFLGGTGTINITASIVNNGTQPVALVKTGTGQVNLNGPAGTAYSGGTYVTQGVLNILTNTALGAATNPITLSGGTLQFNIADPQAAGTGGPLGGLGQSVNVTANSLIILDNGVGPNTDTDLAFGALTINGGTTLGIRGFDSLDATFTGTHSFSGTPTIDLPQLGGGSDPNTATAATVIALSGPITGSGFYVTSSANANNTAARLQIGGGATDAAPNTYTGKVILMPGSNNEDLFVELNKPAGVTAVTGDLELNGGKIISNFDNQIADTSNLTLNWGGIDFNGKNETIASVTQNGGFVRTNFDGSLVSNNVVTVTGDYNFTGADDFNAVGGSNFTSNGLDVGSNSTLVVVGKLRMNGYSRAAVGATASNLIVGGLEMTGTTLTETGLESLIRLNGDVTTLPSSNTARLGNTTVIGARVELNGTRTFNVADGSAGLDLSVSSGLVDSTNPAAVGGLIKTGPGTMQLEGSANANNYTGPTNINEGTVVLFKDVGVNALGAGVGTVTVGDGIGGAKADKLIIRNSEQLSDTTNLTVASSGVVDLKTFSTSESINSLAGNGSVELGATSTLSVIGMTDTVFDGAVEGTGGLTKSGTGKLNLNGANNYLGRTSVEGGTLAVRGSIGAVTTLLGSTLSPGEGAARLNVRGNFDLQSGATLKIELGGPIPGTSYDQIIVTGSITLAGDLQGSLINGFTGSPDFFFIIINDGTDPVNGTFNGLPEGSLTTFSGTPFQIFYSANSETGTQTGGNDVLVVVPEPTTAASLLMVLGSMLGFNRFRRRHV